MFIFRFVIALYILLGLNIKLFSQNQLNDAIVKAGLIYNICNEVVWEQYALPDTFLIGVYGKDFAIFNEIKKIENKSIKGKPVKVKRVEQLQQLENTDVLYLDYSNRSETNRVYRLIKNTNTLFITDRNDFKRFLMINIYSIFSRTCY